jgi:hypothetical protein
VLSPFPSPRKRPSLNSPKGRRTCRLFSRSFKVAQEDTASVSPRIHPVYWLSFFCSSAINPFWNTGSNSWA